MLRECERASVTYSLALSFKYNPLVVVCRVPVSFRWVYVGFLVILLQPLFVLYVFITTIQEASLHLFLKIQRNKHQTIQHQVSFT